MMMVYVYGAVAFTLELYYVVIHTQHFHLESYYGRESIYGDRERNV